MHHFIEILYSAILSLDEVIYIGFLQRQLQGVVCIDIIGELRISKN